MIILLIAYCSILYFAFRWLTYESPPAFKVAEHRPRTSPADFIRAAFRKLGQRQLRKNDRRLFAAGDRRAFA